MEDPLEAAITDLNAELSASAPEVESFSEDLCSAWNRVRPFWSGILTLVSLIPTVGGPVKALLGGIGVGVEAACSKEVVSE